MKTELFFAIFFHYQKWVSIYSTFSPGILRFYVRLYPSSSHLDRWEYLWCHWCDWNMVWVICWYIFAYSHEPNKVAWYCSPELPEFGLAVEPVASQGNSLKPFVSSCLNQNWILCRSCSLVSLWNRLWPLGPNKLLCTSCQHSQSLQYGWQFDSDSRTSNIYMRQGFMLGYWARVQVFA